MSVSKDRLDGASKFIKPVMLPEQEKLLLSL